MSKIAFLGPKYLVNPLSAAGIDVFACESGRYGCGALSKITAAGEHSIVFVTERLAAEMMDEIEKAEEKDINVVLLPDHRGSTGLLKESLQNLIKKATGALQT